MCEGPLPVPCRRKSTWASFRPLARVDPAFHQLPPFEMPDLGVSVRTLSPLDELLELLLGDPRSPALHLHKQYLTVLRCEHVDSPVRCRAPRDLPSLLLQCLHRPIFPCSSRNVSSVWRAKTTPSRRPGCQKQEASANHSSLD